MKKILINSACRTCTEITFGHDGLNIGRCGKFGNMVNLSSIKPCHNDFLIAYQEELKKKAELLKISQDEINKIEDLKASQLTFF